MGRVAVVGGSGNVAREVIDAIIKKGNYEVTICSRKSEAPADLPSAIKWVKVDYSDHSSLLSAFSGIDTVLSFVAINDADMSYQTEKHIIDAAIAAGVNRIAPSQWAARSNSGIAHYAYKDKIAEYLAKINSEKKAIQYCLFQPGFFVDYLAYPHPTTPNFHNMPMMFDFQNRRILMNSGSENAPITMTSVADMALVVAEALDYSEPWPVTGGICGTQTTVGEIIALGEKLRGPFNATRVEAKSVQDGKFEVPWVPLIDHPSVPVEAREIVSKMVLREYLISAANGGWSVSDEWNKLLGIELTSMEDFLTKVWQ